MAGRLAWQDNGSAAKRFWLPSLAPSVAAMKLGQKAATPAQWATFTRKYRAEMARPENAHVIRLLATLSRQTHFSVGCYCEQGQRCHRSVLRALLQKQGAAIFLRRARLPCRGSPSSWMSALEVTRPHTALTPGSGGKP